MLQGVTEAALTAVDGGSLEDVLKSFTVGFITGVAIHGVGKALSKMKFCFVAGTGVLMATGGIKAIENIRVGDMVKSFNPATGKAENKRVLQTFENTTDELVTVFNSDGQQVTGTPGHKFYANNRWVSAEDLRAGDILVNVNGQKVVVEKIQHEILESPVKVYNFEVAGNHTYFVGDDGGIAVHNAACSKAKASKITADKGEFHHIASDKSIKTKYTKKYKEIFDKGNMKLSDKENIIYLKNHHGRHTNAYKDYVLDELQKGTKNCAPNTAEFTSALKNTLKKLADKLKNNPRLPYIK